jgi:hypothetical protein
VTTAAKIRPSLAHLPRGAGRDFVLICIWMPEALSFLNATPRQAAGEATGFVRNDGSAAIFYLEPGSG